MTRTEGGAAAHEGSETPELDAWRDDYWRLVRGAGTPGRLSSAWLEERRVSLGLDEADAQTVADAFYRAFDDFEESLADTEGLGQLDEESLESLEAARLQACISRSEAGELVRTYGLVRLPVDASRDALPGWFAAAMKAEGVALPPLRRTTVDGGDPEDEANAELAAFAADDDAYADRVAELTAAESWDALVELHVARVETREDVHEQTSLLREVARLFRDELTDVAQAFETLETAFTLDPTDDETVADLELVTAHTQGWNQLLRTANAMLDEASEPRSQIALCLRLAKWYEADLGRKDYALPLYARVLELEPNNVLARRKAATYLYDQGDWRGAGQRLEEALAFATRPAERAAILTDIGDLLERFAGEPEQSLVRYQRAIEADPTYLPALDALEKIHETKGQTSELAAILERKLAVVKEPLRANELRVKLGTLLESLGAPVNKVVALYLGVLEHDAKSLPATRGLERIYETHGRWKEQVELLERRLGAASTDGDRVALLLRIAALHEEEFRKPDQAAERLEQAANLDASNPRIFEPLARCYQKQKRWEALVGCLDRYATAVDDRAKKLDVLMWKGEVLADELASDARAVDAYLTVVAIDGDHVGALGALAKLHDRMGQPQRAIEFASRVAELASDGAQRVESLYRIGKQLEEKKADRSEARARYEQALDLDPHHLPSLAALRAIVTDEGDYYQAARYLDTEQQHTNSPRLRGKLLVDLGNLRKDRLGEPEEARRAFDLAYTLDSDNEDAALELARWHVSRGAFAEAEPFTVLLEKKAPAKERALKVESYLLFGRVQLELGNGAEAVRAFSAATRADLMSREANRGLGDANFFVKDWAGALSSYQKVLTSLNDDESAVRAEVLHRVACVKREQGQPKQAIYTFEKALQLVPTRRPTLEALADLHAEAGEWVASCNYRHTIIDAVQDEDERLKLLLELAEVAEKKLDDSARAIGALEATSRLRPDDNQLRHRLLALYQKTERWPDVVRTIGELADGDPSPRRRARYTFTTAQVVREKLLDVTRAADLFDKALDLDAEYAEAFERLVKMLSAAEEWERLEAAYLRMLGRVSDQGKTDLEYTLHHELGILYRDQLGDSNRAADAFREAIARKPDDLEERRLLAELAVNTGDAANALEQYRSVLAQDPLNVDAYRSIYTLHVQEEAYDAAWCVASVLAYLGAATEEEAQFYADWRAEQLASLSSGLDAGLWASQLVHDTQDPHISTILEAVFPSALKAKLADLTARNQRPTLPENLRQDPASATGPLPKAFWWSANALGLPSPQLYAVPGQAGLFAAVPSIPLACAAGQNVLTGLSLSERTFLCGRHLAMYRGDHLAKLFFPTVTELTVLLFGALRLVSQLPAPPEYAAQVQSTTQALGKFIEPIEREALKRAVNDFVEAGGRTNIKRWARAVDTTAARAGLLLSGDLAVAQKVLVAEPAIPGDLTPPERMKELMLFSISDEYLNLRKHIGLAIKTDE
ncbi:MAG: tetratricopeptide repeat protein [Deltaproteobacteria bacterium]|nr:tetratricopeptide repeat protein [Deltaproteobacteria bacterium]